MTERYAVIGNPIAQSKSPQIHAAFARQLGHDLRYDAILGPLGGFRRAVDEFRGQGGRGLNVTVPFKLDAFALATERTERAERAGAVNTLKFEAAAVIGDNTDGAGLIADVRGRLGVRLEATRILLMGAGGAARGVLLPLLRERPASIAIANRTVDKATALAHQFQRFGPVDGGDYARLAGHRFDVVINATSASLYGEVPPVPSGIFAPGALAYDMAYGSGPTAFLAFARDQDAGRLADGLGMLVAQAAESFYLWRGVRPDIEPVIALLRAR
jgi:shikimate dehydrogenase